uniref:Uncharacterized protein n=1 Tax=Glossina austeni TaxID=7395 RepID=A0A1A9UK09_GLOAU
MHLAQHKNSYKISPSAHTGGSRNVEYLGSNGKSFLNAEYGVVVGGVEELSILIPLSSNMKVPSEGKIKRPSAAALTNSRNAKTCFSVTLPCNCMPCKANAIGLLLIDFGSEHQTTGMVAMFPYTWLVIETKQKEHKNVKKLNDKM